MSTRIEALPETLSQYAAAARDEDRPKKNELGQDEFLKLMLTQMKHQDPMQPMQNGEFIGQIAQFSTVTGIEKMSDSLESLTAAYGANRTLEAARLVGHEIIVADGALALGETGEAAGRFVLEASTGDVTLDVSSADGTLVRRVALGEHAAGTHDFVWDGLDEDGERLPAGRYTASITAAGEGEERAALTVLAARTVDSVEFGEAGRVIVNTADGASIDLADIRQIRRSIRDSPASSDPSGEASGH